jgi:hypothetical protein
MPASSEHDDAPDATDSETVDASFDPRVRAAWRTWLSALATDAEAAMAAALAYESLEEEGRDAWLDALQTEAAELDVPQVALYAPLLAVEADAKRRARMADALTASGVRLEPPGVVRALHGVSAVGEHVCVVLSPLYLDFVELLVCRYDPDGGVLSARRDPVRHIDDVLGRKDPQCTVDGVTVAETPLADVIEGLAHAVVADRRKGRDAPAALSTYAHLFVPDLQAPPASQTGIKAAGAAGAPTRT